MASVKSGKVVKGNVDLFRIKSTEKEYSFTEKANNRIICLVKKTFDKINNRCELQIWLDMFMPTGFYFQCTPETTNNPILNRMSGATFSNSDAAISL